MTQVSFSAAEYTGKRKQTRRDISPAEIKQVALWEALRMLIEPVYPEAGKGQCPHMLKTMERIHLRQNWFGYGDPAMEVALYEVAPLRRFARLLLPS